MCSSTLARRRNGGSILLYSVVTLTIAGFAVLGIARLSATHLRGVSSAEQRMKAQYVAESGASQVIDWFNRGSWTWAADYAAGLPYPPAVDPSTFHTWQDCEFTDVLFQTYFQPDDETGRFVDTEGHSVITESLDVMRWFPEYVPVVHAPNGSPLATITNLKIYTPDETGDDGTADPDGTVCWVECTARTVDGTEAWVQLRLTDNDLAFLDILAAIMSKTGVEGSGQFNVHWGEVWAHEDVDIPNTAFNGVPKDNEDPWFFVRAEGVVEIGGNDTDGTQKVGYLANGLSIPSGAQNYGIPYLTETLHPDIHKEFHNRENLLQHVPDLEWPVFEYERMKMACKIYGFPIYRTTAGGLIVYDKDLDGYPVIPPENRKFEDVFGNQIIPTLIDSQKMPPIYFIDTIDGNPPNGNVEDGGNVATITEQGNSTFYYGLFFLAANLDMEGSGNPPTIWAERPDQAMQLIKKCRVQGLIYTYGTFDHNGQSTMYGAVYAEQGFGAGGCPEVYYDYRLGDILRNRLGSSVVGQVWRFGYKYTYSEGETPDPYYLQEELQRSDWL